MVLLLVINAVMGCNFYWIQSQEPPPQLCTPLCIRIWMNNRGKGEGMHSYMQNKKGKILAISVYIIVFKWNMCHFFSPLFPGPWLKRLVLSWKTLTKSSPSTTGLDTKRSRSSRTRWHNLNNLPHTSPHSASLFFINRCRVFKRNA